MTEIVLTDEQARIVTQARGRVTLRTPAGETVGVIDAEEAAILREWKNRPHATPAPAFTDAQMARHFEELRAEWNRTGGYDRETMTRMLDRLATDDPPQYRHAGRP